MVSLLGEGLLDVLVIIAPLAIGFSLLAIVGNLVEVGIYAVVLADQTKFNRMNPFKGLKNMLSTKSLGSRSRPSCAS